MDIPNRSLIATYYWNGNIDDGAVYRRERNGELVFLGHGFDADCIWDTKERKWMLHWGALERGAGNMEPEPLDPYEPCGCRSCTEVE